jgi:hypothetical protein
VELWSLTRQYGDRLAAQGEYVPPITFAGAIGLYTYYERLAQGLRQLMCGARKFALEHISRDDIAALTPDASRISGIQLVTELDADEVDRILG